MRRLQTKYRAVIGVLLFYLPFHIFLSPTYWDDATFAKMLGEYHNNLLSYTITRYETWSSRITIELVLPFLTTWPAFIWKTLNLLMIALLYFDLVWIMEHLFDLREKRTYVMTAVLLCAFPFSIMAQTGWIATTTNYLWVIALGLYAINRMRRRDCMGRACPAGRFCFRRFPFSTAPALNPWRPSFFWWSLGFCFTVRKKRGNVRRWFSSVWG